MLYSPQENNSQDNLCQTFDRKAVEATFMTDTAYCLELKYTNASSLYVTAEYVWALKLSNLNSIF